MVWTFMGNARMYEALRDYGDRIDTIGLFSFKVDATGTITESGVAISNMLTYINKWPHIRWLLTIANDGANSIFKALRDNTDGAQDTFCSELVRIMEKYPWCSGVDIDLEKGDDYSTHEASTAMFKHIYETVKAYDSTKEMNICLPGMTSVNGSVGGENWCVYGDLDQYCDTASIMSYGMAWAGSAPGPVSPRSWLEGIYDYATQVMNPDKVFLGMPAYGWNWQIYDTPENIGKYYRGTSHTYYAAKYWMQGLYNFTDDAPPQPFIPIVSYWDDYDMGPWALPHVYDYMEGRDAVSKEYPQMAEVINKKQDMRVVSVTVKPTLTNCSGTIWFTDLMLQEGPALTGYVPHTESRLTEDSKVWFNGVVRSAETVIVCNVGDTSGGLDVHIYPKSDMAAGSVQLAQGVGGQRVVFPNALAAEDDLALLASVRECTKNGVTEPKEGFYQYSAAWNSKHMVTLEDGKSARVLFELQQMTDGGVSI
uniref:GH18 domain-containing protein n=1 Tax=uncultured prokaryote TaxID=198431 RepID=A0A0H5Q6L2_9ZZZZ|nr:hypothetical protein [uncultured prokaryote]